MTELDPKLIVIVVLGLLIVGMVGYYLLVAVPAQQLLYFELQRQTQEAQVQVAIQYCSGLGQQYNFGTGGCEVVPIQTQVSGWLGGSVLPSLDLTFNPFNPESLVSRSFSSILDFSNYLNPANPSGFWSQLLFGVR